MSLGYTLMSQGYGCMSLTEFAAPVKAEGAEQTLKHVLEQGVTLLNTATFYGQGLNEEIIGDNMHSGINSHNHMCASVVLQLSLRLSRPS